MSPICCRSQPHLPLQILYSCQSICDFFVIWSTSDVVLLPIGRVQISDNESAPGTMHAAVARLHLFRVLGALAGFPTHHLKHANSPYCEVRPVMDSTVCCRVLARSSVAFFKRGWTSPLGMALLKILSDAMGVELFFFARTASGSGAGAHTATFPFCLPRGGFSRENLIFFT
jgi:hypothetical protein